MRRTHVGNIICDAGGGAVIADCDLSQTVSAMIRVVLTIDRRTFLGVCAAATGLGFSASAEAVVYPMESFDRDVLVVGALVSTKRDQHLRDLREIKSRTKYELRRVRHRSSDRLKIGCAREMVRYFVQQDDGLRFVGAVIRPGASRSARSDQLRIAERVALLASSGLPENATLRFREPRAPAPSERQIRRGLRGRTGPDQQAALLAAMQTAKLTFGYAIVPRTENDELFELSNLLNGTLFLDVRTANQRVAASPGKAAVALRLRSLLEAPSLSPLSKKKWMTTIRKV